MKTTLHLVSQEADATSADAAALERVAGGDIAALGEIFDRHGKAVLAYVARIDGRRDAEDVVQSTFIRAAKVAATFDRRAGSARPWLMGIASRVVLERRRSFARLARAALAMGAPTSMTASETNRTDVQRALERLSAPKRIVVVLAEVEGYTCEEISLMLDVPVGTVWTRLHHARRELRAFFEEELR